VTGSLFSLVLKKIYPTRLAVKKYQKKVLLNGFGVLYFGVLELKSSA
jgi:hypothetical protein